MQFCSVSFFLFYEIQYLFFLLNVICGVNKIHRGIGTRSRAKAKDREIVKWDKLIGALLSTAKTPFAMAQKTNAENQAIEIDSLGEIIRDLCIEIDNYFIQ